MAAEPHVPRRGSLGDALDRSRMDKRTVSIIIPCYNAAPWVAEAIGSALEQTWPRTEVIVIDDGSTDESLEVIRRFEARLRWETGPNRGGCAARNRGLALARGEYIQFLDADDVMEPHKVERQMTALSSLSAHSMATCPWRHFTHERGQGEPVPQPYWRNYERGIDLLVDMWLNGGYFTPHCWLTPRAVIDRAGGWDESLRADQDGEFFGRVLIHAENVAFVHDCMVFYRTPGKNNVSASIGRNAAESRFHAWESLQRHLLAARDDRRTRRAILRRLRAVAYSYCRNYTPLVERAARHEARLRIWDFDPALPPVSRYLIGSLGLERALMLRGLFKR